LIQESLFDVSVSTKATEGNGIGLLYVRTDICDLIEGSRYGFFSEGKGKGAKFWIDLRIVNNK
jgi:signal transduction histidine kinase